MTFSKQFGSSGLPVGADPSTAELNALDADHANALDKTGDTLTGNITNTGAWTGGSGGSITLNSGHPLTVNSVLNCNIPSGTITYQSPVITTFDGYVYLDGYTTLGPTSSFTTSAGITTFTHNTGTIDNFYGTKNVYGSIVLQTGSTLSTSGGSSTLNNLTVSSGNFNCQTATIYTTVIKTTNYVIGANDRFILSNAGLTHTLPTAVLGRTLTIKDKQGTAGSSNITLLGTVDGVTNPVINTNYGKLSIISDGTNWFSV